MPFLPHRLATDMPGKSIPQLCQPTCKCHQCTLFYLGSPPKFCRIFLCNRPLRQHTLYPWGGCAVSISAPWCDEGGQVAVTFSDWNRVVAVPCIKDRFLLTTWHWHGLMEGWGCVVCLSLAVDIQCLQVYSVSWLAIFLLADNHPVTPSYRLSDRHWLDDPETNISV